jgi:hypothetical protein
MKFEFDKNKEVEAVIKFLIEISPSFILKLVICGFWRLKYWVSSSSLVSGLSLQNPDDLAYLSFARNPF